MTIRVVLVDDQALLRTTFTLLIDSTPDLEVVGHAGSGTEALEVVERTRPDVVLMDIRMPGMDGLAATRAIAARPALAGTHVVMLTTHEVDDLVVAALRAGASGFLGKGVEPAVLLDAIRTVAAGEALLSPTATAAVISHVLGQHDAPRLTPSDVPGFVELTAREVEILTFVGLGWSNDQIAARLVISPATAKTHVNRAMSKLGARDRAQLVVTAYETGLVQPGSGSTRHHRDPDR